MLRHRNLNPHPEVVSDRVWSLLHAWAEWRSIRSCPKALPAPEETGRWVLQNDRLAYDQVVCIQPRSTKPPDPGALDVFNQCMMDLPEHYRAYLAAIVERQDEPWLKGPAWRRWMQERGLNRRGAGRRFKTALMALQRRAHARRVDQWSL